MLQLGSTQSIQHNIHRQLNTNLDNQKGTDKVPGRPCQVKFIEHWAASSSTGHGRIPTSEVHLMSRCATGLLSALVAGDGCVFESAPVLLVPF